MTRLIEHTISQSIAIVNIMKIIVSLNFKISSKKIFKSAHI